MSDPSIQIYVWYNWICISDFPPYGLKSIFKTWKPHQAIENSLMNEQTVTYIYEISTGVKLAEIRD
jgi:hypothetical protein